MSGVEMKDSGQPQSHTYPTSDPPPYSPPQPAYGPTVVQPGPATVIRQGTTTVIHGPGVMTVQPPGMSAILVTNQMSPKPTMYRCPSCSQQIVTRVVYKPSLRTHLFALLLCVVGCWPCVCLPYCMDTCNNADHYCPNCSAYVGSYAS